LSQLFGAAVGCGSPDLQIRNPMVAGAVPQNRIVKPHNWTESHRGLPPGSMQDEAILDKLDPQQVCVNISLHELSAIDLTTAKISLSSNNGPVVQPAVQAEPPVSQTYNGLVAHQQQTGTREECRYANGQSVCETHPVYQTTMVAGPVDVFMTRGRLCAPNDKLVTADTQKLTLDISLPTSRPGGVATIMGIPIGGSSKDSGFVWGFTK
jgi:hypothetical protein